MQKSTVENRSLPHESQVVHKPKNNLLKRYLTPKEPIHKREKNTLGALPFLLILGLWSLVTYTGLVDELFLPTPTGVITSLYEMTVHQGFLMDVWTSVYRIMLGYFLAALVAIPLGIFMGSYPSFRSFFEPITGVMRYLPVTALIPLFILWLGIGETQKLAVIFFGTFFPLVFMVMDVSSNVSKDLLHVSYTLGAKRKTVFTKVLIPASMPGVMDSLRTVLGWSWTYLVVAELVAAQAGIGNVIMTAQRFMNTEQIIAGVLVIGALGFFSDRIFMLLYRKFFPYMSTR
ncbi:ABC transporter permease [Geomicrobium sediminis]|uniref:NitT/TauT family transport system permease protein n=1 Tax=Geomicrobium sediminis TaxID=1347788 RepID=A0ABS2PCX6_9BACL|nr:ABC transporter permease [Geomicrobium sediminis]MBM7632811.1 NitT/TauT family transport system permease protein [Geomicrobium sediminis]